METLGCSTCICTDKTGTLTQNRMRVTTIVVAGRETSAPEVRFGDWLRPAWEVMALCNNARQDGGDPTEVALRTFCEDVHPMAPQERWPRLYESPFDAVRQRMITTHRAPDGSSRVLMKGAPERVLACCTHRWQDNRVVNALGPMPRSSPFQTARMGNLGTASAFIAVSPWTWRT